MAMIYQNDTDCLPIVRKVGCFVRSCGILAENKVRELHLNADNSDKTELTADQINRMWSWGKDTEIIDNDNCLIDSAKMATYALRLLGDTNGSFIEVATKYKKELSLYPWAKRMGYSPDFFIQKIMQSGPSVYHFRVVDSDNNLIQDPHDPVIHMIKPLYTICYKYINK